MAAGLLPLVGALSFGAGSITATASDGGSAAAARLTLQARPLVVSAGVRVTLSGSVGNRRAAEDVKIQAKDCGLDFFRVVAGAVTGERGEWFEHYSLPGPSTSLRAVWNGATSAEVAIRKRAPVRLWKRAAGIEVRVLERSFWRKRVFIERFDRRLGTWRAVKTLVLTDRSSRGGVLALFTVRLPTGTRLRAVFPRSQTGPCYLAGTSNTLIT